MVCGLLKVKLVSRKSSCTTGTSNSVFSILHLSLPFPVDDEESGGDGPVSDPGHHGMGKGLSREQNEGLDMVKHIMLSLDENDGLDQIYTFRLVSIY